MCHVLIIEDEALIALNIQAVLEEGGATSFDIAETEEEAVAAATARRPDVITSDVRLKRGSGPAAVQTIFGLMGEMPVIFITATPDACLPCEPPGVVIAKPLNESVVSQAFKQILEDVSRL